MSKGYRFYVDTETTGFDDKKDQILELAGVVKDSSNAIVDSFEYKVKLKHNVIPGPRAILINKINPYSKIWASESITENECAKQFSDLVKKYYPEGSHKPFFTAYNADFDKDKLAVMFARNGFKFSDNFNKSVFDPLKTVRKLTAAGIIKTKLNSYGKPSNSMGDVAEALGIEFDGEAHRAMADVKVLVELTDKVVRLAIGQEDVELLADPASFKPGSVYRIVSDSKSSGIKIRHILVLRNEVQSEFLIALDEDDLKTGFKSSSIRQFNYGTIIGEGKVDVNVESDLKLVVQEKTAEAKKKYELALAKAEENNSEKPSLKSIDFQSEIDRQVNEKIKPEPFDEGPKFDEESKNFEMIEQIQEHMVRAKDKRQMFDFMLSNIREKFNGDEFSARAMMTRVENLACAKGYPGWTQELFPQEGIKFLPPKLVNGAELRVALHPKGHYAVGLTYDKNGTQAKELKDCKNIKDLKTFVSARVGKIPELTAFIDELPHSDSFTDPKHSIVIESELKTAIDELLVYGASDDVKAGVAGVMNHLKVINPGIFGKYKLPIDPALLNDSEYWADKTRISGNTQSTKASAPSENKYHHISPGEEASKTPCALCGRPLSAQQSLESSLGPTCRKLLSVIESDDGELENHRDQYRSYNPSGHRPGDLIAVQYKTTSGKENELLGEIIDLNSTHSFILDKRKFKRSLESGIEPELAIYISTIKFPHGSISGVSKLKAN